MEWGTELPPGVTAERAHTALENAEAAFWKVIAEAFPEAPGGDVSPDWTVRRERDNEWALGWWLSWNHPGGA